MTGRRKIPEVWRVQESLGYNDGRGFLKYSDLINSETEQVIRLEVDNTEVALWIAKRLNVAELFIPEVEDD